MSWRTVVISRRCKLDLKMNYLVVRTDEDTTRVFLDDISVLIIENTAVSITGCLLAELTRKKIKVIFCDEKRNPCSELMPYYGSHDCSRKIEQQIRWKRDTMDMIWGEIVSEKIRKQAQHLYDAGKTEQGDMLMQYASETLDADPTNREGHAAKVYFNALFGMDFSRAADNVTNAVLNYGYGIILSSFNREIAANGYLTQLGIFHRNMFNQFNLSCDFMEPYRVLIDRIAAEYRFSEFDKNARMALVDVLNGSVIIDGAKQYVSNAIKIYCKSVFDALNDDDISHIKFYDYEL